MPGDIPGCFAQEVFVADIGPQVFDCPGVVVPLGEHLHCRIAGFVDPVLFFHRVVEAPAQGALGLRVELTQQGGAPGIPQGGVGGVDVGHGEHVEIIQVHQIAHLAGKFVDYVRVGDVLALGRHAHHQVASHQPGHQFAVPGGEPVTLAEGNGVFRAQFGMVAATAFGDVVVKTGGIEQFRLGQAIEHLAGQGEFLAQVFIAQPAHVLDHQQGVRIHGVDVEQVVLHHADDAAELRQVFAENTVALHASQLREKGVGAAQQLHEQAGVFRVVAEGLVDLSTIVDQRANRRGTNPFKLRVLGHQHKGFQQGAGVFLEDLRAGHFQVVIADLEAAVEWAHLIRLLVVQDHLIEQLQQHLVEYRQGQRHSVEPFHEMFYRQIGTGILVAQAGGELALMIE